jgi:hypothetical protein
MQHRLVTRNDDDVYYYICTLRTLKASVLASVPWGEAEAGSPPGPNAGGTPRHAASRPHTARRRRSLMPHEISARIS